VRRRELIGLSLASLLPLAMRRVFGADVARADSRSAAPMKYRTLGRTGEKVSIVGLGGAHIGMQSDERESIRIIRSALDGGMNFLDNSWDYHEGQSEIRMGKALRDGYRDKAFLMTKIDGRTRVAAAKQIDESLKRLQTDRVDLLQLHEIIYDEDPSRVFGKDGAIEALREAQTAGKARYLGFTGHKSPRIHLAMLKAAKEHGFRFDAVQLPLNAMDAHFDSFEKLVVPKLVEDEIGVLGMKAMGGPFILRSKTLGPEECLRYALSLPTSVVITGCDSMRILRQALEVAGSFEPLTTEQRGKLLARTREAAQAGKYERYKTTGQFDATSHHPEWLG